MITKKKIYLTLILVFTVTALAPFLFDQIVARYSLTVLREKHIALEVEKASLHYPEYKKDVAVLNPMMDFLNGPKLRDAGPYLNPRISWQYSNDQKESMKSYETTFASLEKISLSEDIRKDIQKVDGPFFKLDPRQFTKIQTDWLRKLQEFDHWDIDKNSPVDLFPRFSYSTPFPEFDLVSTKIHLLNALNNSDAQFLQAVRDVVHYGELSLTTETLVGEMIFVATLKEADEALSLRPHLRKQMGPWVAVIKERERLKRVYWAVNQFARPSLQVPMRVWKQAYLDQVSTMGICASIRESTAIDWPIWAAMNDAMGTEYKEYRKLISQNSQGCRLTWIKEKTPAWVQLPNEANSLFSSGNFDYIWMASDDSIESTIITIVRPLARIVEWMPQTRRLISTVMASIATPNYTNLYDKKIVVEKSASRKVSSEKVASGQAKE